MKSIILTILLFLLLASCSKKNDKIIKFTPSEIASLALDSTRSIQVEEDAAITVDLNPFLKEREYNLGEMIKTIEVLPLESTDQSILSTINNIVVTDSNIYIQDEYQGGGVVIFDKKGSFVKRIERGQGPGEIISLKHIAFDTVNNELIVYTNRLFSFFTPDGQFKRRDRIPLNAYSFAILPDGYLFRSMNGLNNNHINPDIEYLILITDKSYKLRSVGFPYFYAKDNNYEGGTRYINLNGNAINVTFKFTNSVYQYIDDFNMQLKYTLDISRKGIPERLLQDNFDRLMSELENNDYTFYMGGYVENKAHDFFRLINLHTRLYTFIYRDKQTGNCMGGINKLVDMALYIPLNEPVSTYGKYFVSYYLPDGENTRFLTSKIFPRDVVEKLKSLSEDDNPVLVFYELKDF
jgi:hypothetical protein